MHFIYSLLNKLVLNNCFFSRIAISNFGSIDFYGPKKFRTVKVNGSLTFSDRQSKLVTVSDSESKSVICDEFPDRESQLFK